MNAPVTIPPRGAGLEPQFRRLQRMIERPDEGEPARADTPLATAFDLAPFEHDLLLLCAGLEVDTELAAAWMSATGAAFTTPGEALRLIPGGDWRMFAPGQTLFRWRLLERGDEALSTTRLRIADRVLQYLTGHNEPDATLRPILRAVPMPATQSADHAATTRAAIEVLSAPGPALLLQFTGADADGQEDAAAAVAGAFGLRLHLIDATDLPDDAAAADDLAARWEREAALLPGALLVSHHRGAIPAGARKMIERLGGLVMLAGPATVATDRPSHVVRIDLPAPPKQRLLWAAALGDEAEAAELDDVAATFRLGARRIANIAAHWRACASLGDARPSLRQLCREGRRLALDDLAQRIEPRVGMGDLILPPAQKAVLGQMISHARHRMTVLHDWGFAARGERGLGTAALFHGESGTGKTMACEVLASALGLDLHRIDLSAVVSKYIGETEKNISRIFDAADAGGTLLLFDEADALFGKRSEVKDSHDRYANIEIAHLLQRLENYGGVAVLTSNMRSALDPAFTRRLRFIVHFPFPDVAQREAIWRGAMPAAMPREGIDPALLARVRLSGGQIHNAALGAAFIAAERGGSLGMDDLREAIQAEVAKGDKRVSDADFRGWP